MAALFALGSRWPHTQPSSEPSASIPHLSVLSKVPKGQGGAMPASPQALRSPFLVSGVGRFQKPQDESFTAVSFVV